MPSRPRTFRQLPPQPLRHHQSRRGSLVEAATNVGLGYLLAMLTQAVVYPLFAIDTAITTDAIIAAILTAVSLLHSYLVRRLFERALARPPLPVLWEDG